MPLFSSTAKKIPLEQLIASGRGPAGARGTANRQGAAPGGVDLNEAEATKKDACAC